MRNGRLPEEPAQAATRKRFGRRDWLIAFVLLLATIQCGRADFFVNNTFLDWHAYAVGQAPLPYQGRAGLMPIFRWAENSAFVRHVAERYANTVRIGTLYYEPVTVEKFMSLLLGLISLAAMMLVATWWNRRRGIEPWWLTNTLLLLVLAVTMTLRATQNYWYPYDLPHAALFGIGAMLALEGFWPLMLVCFALDVPLRETALFSILMLLPVFLVQQPGKPRWAKAALLFGGMAVYWAVVRLLIARHFAGNLNLTYPRLSQNLHEILFPHHWPQLFSAGGYLVIFVWLERRRLVRRDSMLLYGCVLCVPITLWFGVWTETRVWLEWSLPVAALAAAEAASWLADRAPADRAPTSTGRAAV